MNTSTSPYSSYLYNFDEQKGLEWMTDDGSYQQTTISASSQPEPEHNWVSLSQQLEVLTAHMDAKLRELQDLNHKKQGILARLRAFNATTTTPTWNIPPQPTTSASSSTAPYAQTVTHPPSIYTAHNRTGEKAFGNEASRKGEVTWHRDTVEHAKKSHICQSCGKGYTRKDSLLRHAAIHASENPYI